jgi:transcriptional regulator with XRE-family HTH domain
MIGKWERGEVTPGAGSVAKLAAVFGMRAEDFTDADPASMTLVELRVRSGYTRAQAAQTAGISVRRLTQYEHLSCRPGPAEAAQLAQLYNVTAELLLASWDRDRAVAYPGLAPEEAC